MCFGKFSFYAAGTRPFKLVEKWLRKMNLKLATSFSKWNKYNAVNFDPFLEGVANFKLIFLSYFFTLKNCQLWVSDESADLLE